MAVVKIDMSEYKLMEEKASLLQEALDKQAKMKDEIIKLEKEKTKALKKNEKIVTIVRKNETVQHVKSKRPIHEIDQFIEGRILSLIDHITSRGRLDMNLGRDSFYSPSRTSLRVDVSRAMNHLEIDAEGLMRNFFYTSSSTIRNQDGKIEESVSTKGLDDYLETIREEEAVKAEADVQNKLAELKKSKSEISDLKDSISKIESGYSEMKVINANDSQLIMDQEKIIDNLSNKLKLAEELNKKSAKEQEKRQETITLLGRETILNRKSIIKKLKEIWVGC